MTETSTIKEHLIAAHTPGPFVICDLRPEWKYKPYVSFWRPKDAGYAYPLVWAGEYSGEHVLNGGRYYTAYEGGELSRFPVERSLVEALSEAPAPKEIDGDVGPVVRNTAALRRKLRKLAYAPALAAMQEPSHAG